MNFFKTYILILLMFLSSGCIPIPLLFLYFYQQSNPQQINNQIQQTIIQESLNKNQKNN